MIRTLFTVLALLLVTPGWAKDDVIAEYLAWLGPEDIVNSQGVRLTNFGSVLAQDRANYHRFGIRHRLDSSDSIFGSRDMRSALPRFYDAGRTVESHILQDVMSGRGHFVLVRVMGTGGRVTHVDVYEGAG